MREEREKEKERECLWIVVFFLNKSTINLCAQQKHKTLELSRLLFFLQFYVHKRDGTNIYLERYVRSPLYVYTYT